LCFLAGRRLLFRRSVFAGVAFRGAGRPAFGLADGFQEIAARLLQLVPVRQDRPPFVVERSGHQFVSTLVGPWGWPPLRAWMDGTRNRSSYRRTPGEGAPIRRVVSSDGGLVQAADASTQSAGRPLSVRISFPPSLAVGQRLRRRAADGNQKGSVPVVEGGEKRARTSTIAGGELDEPESP